MENLRINNQISMNAVYKRYLFFATSQVGLENTYSLLLVTSIYLFCSFSYSNLETEEQTR